MKRVRTYIRLSQKDRSLSKDELETSITNAENEAREYCKSHYDCDLDKMYIERYITGDSPDRPKFNDMINDAKNNEFDILIVRSLSRFTREGSEAQEDYLILLGYYGVEVVSMTENIKNELSRLIYGFVHRIPIILGRLNTNQMRGGKVAQGRAYIRCPFGYKNIKNKKSYWKTTPNAKVVRDIFNRKLRGQKSNEIINELKLNKVLFYKILKTKNYVGIRINDTTFKSIICHKTYIKNSKKEIIDIKEEEYFGFHEPIISPEKWIKLHPEDKEDNLIKLLLSNIS